MKQIKKYGDALYDFFGSLKLAVIMLVGLCVILAVGTFLESYYSRTYAYTFIYGAFWFHCVLLLLGVNILTAALQRLPYQKRLTGFYITHFGLLLILFGSLLTLKMGVDATLTLIPGQFNNTARLEEPVLYVGAQSTGASEIQVPLPKTVSATALDLNVALGGQGDGLNVERFLPYARRETLFQSQPYPAAGLEISLQAPFATQEETLSFPGAYYPSQVDLGPLHVHFLGFIPEQCQLNPKAKWWAVLPNDCAYFDDLPKKTKKIGNYTAEAIDLQINQPALLIEDKQHNLSSLFVPHLSEWPMQERPSEIFGRTIRPNFSSSLRFYDQRQLFTGNALFFFVQKGKLHLAHYQEKSTALSVHAFENFDTPYPLPWMGMKVWVRKFSDQGLPILHYVPSKPTPGDEKPLSAVALRVGGLAYWLASDMDVTKLPLGGGRAVELFLGYRTFTLPWGFRLENFKMDTDPGTANPASYESFVNIQAENFSTLENAHIFMNNPLKKGGYTFFQASYFPIAENQFGSVLAVNKDPGRILKYAGSLILVFGTTLHFYLRRNRKKPLGNN